MEATTAMKVLVVGGPSVGKTSLINQFVGTTGAHAQLKQTTFFTSKEKAVAPVRTLILNTQNVTSEVHFEEKVLFGDTLPTNPDELAQFDGVFLVFDQARQKSFLALPNQLKQLRQVFATQARQPLVILVANKQDLSRKDVDATSVKNFATANALPFICTSAKAGINTKSALMMMTSMLSQRPVATPLALDIARTL